MINMRMLSWLLKIGNYWDFGTDFVLNLINLKDF